MRVRWRELAGIPADRTRDAEHTSGFGLWVPEAGLDALLERLTQVEFEREDERMPYFGALWPAAESLVAKVLGGPALAGERVLDLGCGLGACGLAAARRGAHVTFLDWEPRALEIVAASARANGLGPEAFEAAVGDWRDPPPLGRFHLILGADLLYETRNPRPVARLLDGHLDDGAEAWIADPGRPYARQFPTIAEEAGLALVKQEILPPQPHQTEITLFRLRRDGEGR
jgi:2-polyprenyl-3-methyl-5-hydroxy-6-metoxy-1,4-benzoquinol methylase